MQYEESRIFLFGQLEQKESLVLRTMEDSGDDYHGVDEYVAHASGKGISGRSCDKGTVDNDRFQFQIS